MQPNSYISALVLRLTKERLFLLYNPQKILKIEMS